MVNNWLKNTQTLRLPGSCLLCGEPGQTQRDLCLPCEQRISEPVTRCRVCGIELPESAGVCGDCLSHPPAFDHTITSLGYHPHAQFMVQQLKYHGRLAYARLLAGLMADAILDGGSELPELILPVPLHSRRTRERGFNQAVELARPLAKLFGRPLGLQCCWRKKQTVTQTGLDARARRKNLARSFHVVEPLHYERVAIVDDVMTTGSTANELARSLKRHGVEQVQVWVAARVPN